MKLITLKRSLAVGGMLAATLAVSTGAGVATAATPHTTDVITYSGRNYVAAPSANGTSRFALVADHCTLKADGGAGIPCSFDGAGTVSAAGGHAIGLIRSARGSIVLDESFTFTSATTSVGSGSALEFGLSPRTGTFVGTFTAGPTASPNVLLSAGTITVTH